MEEKDPILVDFDFEAANAKLSKQNALAEFSKLGFGKKENVKYYDRNTSFFDNISCDALERESGTRRRTDDRKLNMETFGVSFSHRGRGRGRGRYRGKQNKN